MKVFENYNSASQKYGLELTNSLSRLGLPPKYLLSACRFNQECGVPQSRLVAMFKEWMKYVVKYNNIDVNNLTYEQFFNIIAQEKSKHCVPNFICSNDVATLGQLNSHKDVQSIPVKNQWCIKSQRWIQNYIDKGYKFFVIYLPNEPLPFTVVIIAVR